MPNAEPIPSRPGLFFAHLIHWALMVLAVPVVALIPSKTLFGVYDIVAFLSLIPMALMMKSLGPEPWTAQTSYRIERAMRIVLPLLIGFFVFSFLLFKNKKGLPYDYRGMY